MTKFDCSSLHYIPILYNNNNDNFYRRYKEKICLLLIFISLPIVIFYGIYVTFYKKNAYPKTDLQKIPDFWVNRAILYNNYTINKQIRHNLNPFRTDERQVKSEDMWKIVCYYNFPTDSLQSLQVNQIDPFLCTHINCAFATIRNNSLTLTSEELTVIKSLVDLQKRNNNLKILLSVGGASENGNSEFPTMIRNHSNRKLFIKSVLNYVKFYGIDGVDLDYEFPNGPAEIVHFTQLLKEFRKTINKQTKFKFILSVAVAAPALIIDNAYNVPYINQFVDYINVMTYDYHFYTKLTPFTGFNSPLYQSVMEQDYLATLNINFTVNYWHLKGMDKEKIIVGLPTYGHSFQLLNVKNNGLYAPAKGYGKLGSNGFVDFAQICAFLKFNQISPIFDSDTKSPFAYKFDEWLSFDDEQSLSFKAEFIRNNNLGGAMVYSLNTDDYKGKCSISKNGNFPLTHKIKSILNN